MAKYKRTPESLLRHRLRLIRKAGIKKAPDNQSKETLPLQPLDQRIKQVLQITEKTKIIADNMLFLVMYDIENDRVRNEIAKYLIRKGCIRIQKSVYIANLKHSTFREIHDTLRQIQQMYDNNDSILIIPVSSDEVKSMKIIGQNVDIELILGNRNTLFF